MYLFLLSFQNLFLEPSTSKGGAARTANESDEEEVVKLLTQNRIYQFDCFFTSYIQQYFKHWTYSSMYQQICTLIWENQIKMLLVIWRM